MGPWLSDSVTRPLIQGFLDAVGKIPGTGKIAAIGLCWGGRYPILRAHGLSADEDTNRRLLPPEWSVYTRRYLESATKPLSIALGSKDGLVDVSSAGTIKDILDAKTEVSHQIQVYLPLFFGHIFSSFHSFINSLILASSRGR
ncbi:hypothetical protein MMC31_007032 [Peltigera leucophlebia]|nr:hypothetical protein [Peltigera leucophlebia]